MTGMIRIAGTGDADEAGHILGLGFSDDPVMTWVFDADNRVDTLERMFRFVLAEATIDLGATYVADGSCACWPRPAHPRSVDDGDVAGPGVGSGSPSARQEMTR